MFKSLEELGLGTYENIATVSQLVNPLYLFHKLSLTGLTRYSHYRCTEYLPQEKSVCFANCRLTEQSC